MNLHDCRIPYFAIPKTVLNLSTKTALLVALEMYKLQSVSPLLEPSTMYRSRQLSDVRRQLVDKAVVVEDTESDVSLKLVELDTATRITLPARVEYAPLSLTSIKVLIACYDECRYSRDPFRITRTREELAGLAEVAVRGVEGALDQLTKHRFILARKLWQKGTEIRLIDPESETWLSTLGNWYLKYMESTPVPERYRQLLSYFDDSNRLRDSSGVLTGGYSVMCPYCKAKGKTFRFWADDEDRWTCYHCHKNGDSRRLWARWGWRMDRRSWQEELSAVCEKSPSPLVPLEPSLGDLDREISL